MQRLQGQDFCSNEHRLEFHREQEQMALARLQQSATSLKKTVSKTGQATSFTAEFPAVFAFEEAQARKEQELRDEAEGLESGLFAPEASSPPAPTAAAPAPASATPEPSAAPKRPAAAPNADPPACGFLNAGGANQMFAARTGGAEPGPWRRTKAAKPRARLTLSSGMRNAGISMYGIKASQGDVNTILAPRVWPVLFRSYPPAIHLEMMAVPFEWKRTYEALRVPDLAGLVDVPVSARPGRTMHRSPEPDCIDPGAGAPARPGFACRVVPPGAATLAGLCRSTWLKVNAKEPRQASAATLSPAAEPEARPAAAAPPPKLRFDRAERRLGASGGPMLPPRARDLALAAAWPALEPELSTQRAATPAGPARRAAQAPTGGTAAMSANAVLPGLPELVIPPPSAMPRGERSQPSLEPLDRNFDPKLANLQMTARAGKVEWIAVRGRTAIGPALSDAADGPLGFPARAPGLPFTRFDLDARATGPAPPWAGLAQVAINAELPPVASLMARIEWMHWPEGFPVMPPGPPGRLGGVPARRNVTEIAIEAANRVSPPWLEPVTCSFGGE